MGLNVPMWSQKSKLRTMKLNKWGYIIAVSLMTVGLLACNKDNAMPDEELYPILFGELHTRSAAGIEDLKEKGFKVYAYLEGNTGKSATFEKYVKYNSSQNVWWYEGLQYWIPETDYWFKAFYPSTLTAGTYNISNTSSAQNYTITGFDITKQEDVVVASAEASVPADALYPSTGSVVNLSFQHLLACVIVEIKTEIDGVSVKSVKLSDIKTNATFNGSYWESTNTTSITYSEQTNLSKGADYADVTGGGILVIPGSTNGVTLTISANKEYNVTLPSISWEGGNKYTYTALIKQNDIVFVDNAPYVEEWDSENATGSVIIK